MLSWPKSEQRQHGVVDGNQMAPQVDQPVLPRRHFGLELLVAERRKEFVGPFQILFPGLDCGLNGGLVGCHDLSSMKVLSARL
jgi:hypothetical protein